MSDSILVRVTLGSYDVVHPSEKQTQVYVQIPDVARASWLLDESFYPALKNEPWPHVVDSAHDDYERRGVVSDSTSEAARKAIVDWLLLSEGAEYDARYDAVQAAWEADQARQHPVAGKLLKENEQLRERLAELDALELGDLDGRRSACCGKPNHLTWLRKVDDTRACPWCVMDLQSESLTARTHQLAHFQEIESNFWSNQRTDQSLAAVANLRIAELNGERDTLMARVAELEAERHSTNESLDIALTELRLLNTQRGDVALLIERERAEGEECVDIDALESALGLGSDELVEAGDGS